MIDEMKEIIAVKRSSSCTERFRELLFGARQYRKCSELVLELCA